MYYNNVYISPKKREAYEVGFRETLTGQTQEHPDYSSQQQRAYRKACKDANK